MADVSISELPLAISGNANNVVPISNGLGTFGLTLGAVCGVMTSAQITTALGYTPYNGATNPAGYITSSSLPNTQQLAKAWVNFNGTTGTTVANEFQCTIRSAYNVSKVVRNTTGDYSVYFNNVFADANYCAIISSGSPYQAVPHAETYSASAFRFKNNYIPSNSGNTLLDSANFSVAIFR